MLTETPSSHLDEELHSKDRVTLRIISVRDDEDGGIGFALRGNVDPRKGRLRGCSLRIKKDSGPIEITFKLKGGEGLQFHQNHPILIRRLRPGEDADCPTDPSSLDGEETSFDVERDCLAGFELRRQAIAMADQLVISRATTEEATFVYSLWFVDRDDNEVEFDPIIKNIARP